MQSSAKRRLFVSDPSRMRPRGLRAASAAYGGNNRLYRATPAYAPMRYYRRSRFPRIVPGYTRRVGYYGRFGTSRRPGAQIEKKVYDSAVTLGTSGGTASVTNATGLVLSGIANGTSPFTRIGQKIIVKSIQVKASFTLPPGATGADTYHLYLVQDSQCNGAAAAITDVFDTPGIIGNEMRNVANGPRFKILKHWQIQLDAQAGIAGAFNGAIAQESLYLKCNIPVVYSSTTGDITEIRSNNLFFCYGSVQAQSTATLNCRIRYTDL